MIIKGQRERDTDKRVRGIDNKGTERDIQRKRQIDRDRNIGRDSEIIKR